MIKRRMIIPRVRTNCLFCKEQLILDYKEPQTLQKYLSERGKIISRGRTGVCAKHQRKLAMHVKRARHLALLPFVAGLK